MQISIAKPPQFEYFQTVEARDLTHMAELCLANNFSPAIFKDGKRALRFFEVAHCIGLDIDNDGKPMPGTKVPTPLMTIEEAKIAFKDYTHLILPSRSHQLEKDGVTVDRFRVILFFEYPITDLDTFYATWHWCKAQWPAIDHQCKDPSRGYYAHSAVASIRGGGLRVKPVVPAPKVEVEPIDRALLTTDSRGKLSRETLEFLVKGAEKGNRNGSTYKAAKEFQQGLYTFEETRDRIISALEVAGTFERDFTKAEATQTIQSAFNTEAKHEPRIVPKAFNLVSIGELYKTEVKMDWIVKDLLSAGGLSLISSDPKAGKSTIARQLMREILRGGTFLGRECRKGAVQYYALEEQLSVLNVSFQRLGIGTEDPLLVHVGDALTETKFQDFEALLTEQKPVLAVVDTVFDFIDVESENNYKEVKRELRRLRQIARKTDTHIMVIHHNSKGSKDDKRRGNRGILGSQAIAGAMDTIIVIELDGKERRISTSGREIEGWFNRPLVFDYADRTYSLSLKTEEDDF